MARKSSRRVSEEERAERRCADRERLRTAAQELLSSEGWARWVRVRSMFRAYSAGNCMLLAYQCRERGIEPHRVAGFRTWLKLGRCVRKGERALRILPPALLPAPTWTSWESNPLRWGLKTLVAPTWPGPSLNGEGTPLQAAPPPPRAARGSGIAWLRSPMALSPTPRGELPGRDHCCSSDPVIQAGPLLARSPRSNRKLVRQGVFR